MARLPRVVVVDVPHHVTQRGNARQVILANDADRAAYLELLRKYSELYHLSLLGYCLMSNHVHLIAIPRSAEALAQTLKHTHGRYASYWNAGHCSTGHVWQGRFYSCPLGNSHLWAALRYVELNPVRASMVAAAAQWPWSSAAAHCSVNSSDTMLEMEPWRRRWTVAEWQEYLSAGESQTDLATLRQCTHTGRPAGTPEFVGVLEQSTLRLLAPRKGGRPKSPYRFRTTPPRVYRLSCKRGTSRLSPDFPRISPAKGRPSQKARNRFWAARPRVYRLSCKRGTSRLSPGFPPVPGFSPGFSPGQ